MKSSSCCIGQAFRWGTLILLITSTTNAFGFGSLGRTVDDQCANLGYPLDPQFEPQVSNNCLACHDDGAGGSGAGMTAYARQNWEFFCPAPPTNLPPIAQANGPYSATEGQAISFSSAGSTDPDGTILSYLWDFGDGMTSMEANPSHTYASASENRVSLTVTDDMSESSMSFTTASISPPVTNDPDIAVADTGLDFNQTEVGATTTLTTSVENTGTLPLIIDSVASCVGTGMEFSWSPSSFEVAPGGSQTLSVMYSPADESTHSGCLEIYSNDPDENPVNLAVNGRGFVPAPQVADLDITNLRTSRRARLGTRTRPVSVKLTLINAGLIPSEGSATLTGTQQGQVVFEAQMPTSIGPGERGVIIFPGYVPELPGEIEWRVSVADEDPDVDEATGTTLVVMGKQR